MLRRAWTGCRAFMYVPGSEARMVAKAAAMNVDTICLDMEDGVAASAKTQARTTVIGVLSSLSKAALSAAPEEPATGPQVVVRVNAQDPDDISALLPFIANRSVLSAVVIPKVDCPQDIKDPLEKLRAAWDSGSPERLHGDSPPAVIAMVESARGLVDLRAICRAGVKGYHPLGLRGLVFGAEDYCQFTGVQRTSDANELVYARSAVVTHAAAYGLSAVDMVCTDISEETGPATLEAECRQGRALGFTGKQVIHPKQVSTVHEMFAPSQQQLERAHALLDAFNEYQRQGKGAFVFDGAMVDMPVVRAAERLLERAAMYESRS